MAIVYLVMVASLLITMALVAGGILQWGGLDRDRAGILAIYVSEAGFLIVAILERLLVFSAQMPWALLPLGVLVVVSAALLAYFVKLKFRSFPLLVFQWGSVVVTSVLLYGVGIAHMELTVFVFLMVCAITGLLAMFTIAVSALWDVLGSHRANRFVSPNDN